MRQTLVVLTDDAATRIRTTMNNWGTLTLLRPVEDDLFVVIGFQVGSAGDLIAVRPSARQAALGRGDTGYEGRWQQAPLELHMRHRELMSKPDFGMTYEELRGHCHAAKRPGPGAATLLVTHCKAAAGLPPEHRVQDLVGWRITPDGAFPAGLAVEPSSYGWEQLAGTWPVDTLARTSVLVVGAGSIGGAAADALAGYGIGRIGLLDHDRLLWHNTVRHVLGDEHIGRFKVDALADHLLADHPSLDVDKYAMNVVVDAGAVRALLPEYQAVLCAADGVAPRRVVSHLARRANRPAVLACVLNDGSVGELLRLRPDRRRGCLLCHRAALVASGGIDPEPSLEAPYGAADTHLPMTAVGADLWLVGELAAKMAVGTVLQAAGEHDQKLAADHAVVGLRPRPGLAPPYDVGRAGEIVWQQLPAPRDDCPTCGAA